MISQSEKMYLETYVLKKGEQIEWTSTAKSLFIDLKIYKQTARTYRVVGLITLSIQQQQGSPDEKLRKIHLTPRKKVKLDDLNANTIRWLEQGWIMKEIRFEKDGKTIKSIHYRMTHKLYQYEEEIVRQREEAMNQEFQNWKVKVESIIIHSDQINKKINQLVKVTHQLSKFHLRDIASSELFSMKWSIKKRLKFLHYVLAFIQLAQEKTHFDWKEIGANYYKEIGGSKMFDANKQEFIDQIEEWAQCPVTLLGLTSLGKITPLYFSGHLAGTLSNYEFGPVHALTDIAIQADQYSTSTTTLWLVENRSILTRIAAEHNFLKEANALLICVDGHLRLSHKLCIRQLLKNSSIQQVLIWCDYDPDGLQIAREIYKVVETVPCKWITHDHDIITTWNNYEKYLTTFLKHRHMEQEQILGGADNWQMWINH